MVKSMYAAVAGLRAHQSKMDVIGNNIANVNTWGYKTQRVSMASSFYQTLTSASEASAGYGGGNASQVGYGSQISSIDVLHTRGGYSPTDGPLDSMINGNGFYVVGKKLIDDDGEVIEPYDDSGAIVTGAGYDSDKIESLKLTRVGSFNFDGSGNLVDSQKNVVYGFLPSVDDDGNVTYSDKVYPVVLPYEKDESGSVVTDDDGNPKQVKLESISIAADGTISGISGDKSITIGKVAIANVPNANALEADQGSYYKIIANTGKVEAFQAGEGSTSLLLTSGLELSNVDLAKEFTEMITTQRGYQANTRIITVTDEMLSDLVNLKR